jgi:hypothetical protein
MSNDQRRSNNDQVPRPKFAIDEKAGIIGIWLLGIPWTLNIGHWSFFTGLS